MPYYTKTQCPACGTAFQTPLDQILDVRVDPDVRQRVLTGAVNVAQCPACGWTGRLNVPFIYHDPEEEAALLYLPPESGRNEAERQKAAGRLTRRLSDSLPPEERKGYLLNPETFITLDSLVRRVLELAGVTEEDMERSAAQQQLLQEMLEVDEEAWEEMLEEHADLIDEGIFYMLSRNIQLMQALQERSEDEVPPQVVEMLEKISNLEAYISEHHPLGREMESRANAMRPFMENPNRGTLIEALVAAPDEEAIETLVQTGAQLIDYSFFQKLVARIEAAETEAERERLKALRRQILDIREDIMASMQAALEERGELLSRLLTTEEPFKMARSHLSELDEAFSHVFQYQIQEARRTGNNALLSKLKELNEVLDQLMEASMPPEVALVRRLLMATSDEEATELLEENREVVDASFLQFLEAIEARSRESGDVEVADRLQELREKAQRFVSPLVSPTAAPPEKAEPSSEEPLGPGEKRGPGGLIISSKK